MHKSQELKKELDHLVQSCTMLEGTEKAMWHAILSNLSEYQEQVLHDIAQQASLMRLKPISTVQCGISFPKKELSRGLSYMSVADDITYDDCDSNTDFTGLKAVDTDSKYKQDGKWFIIAIGYMDCEYDDLSSLCGRNKSYTGICSNGQFEYSLVLKPTILQKEKELNDYFNEYPFEITLPYAPMLRRLVYIETLQEIEDIIDLRLEKNGLNCLRCGWRSIWNVEEPDSPVYTFNNGKYRFRLEANEYMILQGNTHDVIAHSLGDDPQNGQRYFDVVTSSENVAKDSVLKIIVHSINADAINSDSEIMNPTPIIEQAAEQHRIYSRGDLTAFMQSYNTFVRFSDVSTRYKAGLKICAYERGYEYPEITEYFQFSDRPTLFVEFENDGKAFLFDRIVYMIHLLQQRFPEFRWKGGYVNE